MQDPKVGLIEKYSTAMEAIASAQRASGEADAALVDVLATMQHAIGLTEAWVHQGYVYARNSTTGNVERKTAVMLGQHVEL